MRHTLVAILALAAVSAGNAGNAAALQHGRTPRPYPAPRGTALSGGAGLTSAVSPTLALDG
jgi:hypothetical protein